MKIGNSNGADGYWSRSLAWAERIPHAWLEMTGWVVAPDSPQNDPAEWLDAHAQALLVGRSHPLGADQQTGDADEMAALAALAEQVAVVVYPAQPTPRFRKELRQALLSTHRQQAAQRRIFAHPLFEKGVVDCSLLERLEIRSPLFWQIAAAVPVLIAIAALIWRYSRRPTPHSGEVIA